MHNCSLRFCLVHSARSLSYITLAADYRAAFFRAGRAAFAPLEESKVVSSHPLMVNPRQFIRAIVFSLFVSLFSAASVSLAYGQFTLTSSPFHPSAVDPGGSSIATLDLEPNGSNNPVSFSTIPCTVTPVQPTGTPQCAVSPASATPPAQPSLTITTTAATPAGLYIVTVTGTSGSFSQAITLTLNVVDVTEDYTLTVSPTTATPSPVAAGSTATTTVTVTPIASYTGQVTLACLSVSPVATLAPVCSFNPPTVMVTSGIPPTSVLTLSTTGPAPVTRLSHRRIFYALWLAVPGLVLVGAGASGSRRRSVLAALLLIAIASSVLLMPACSAARSLGTNGNTPHNTYTFTLTGADANGAAPGGTTTCTTGVTCGAATVTLAVN
jgi:hypothetical protein